MIQIEQHQTNRKIKRAYALLLLAVAISTATFCYSLYVRNDVRRQTAEIQRLTNNGEFANLKMLIIQLEKENAWLRRRNAELEEIIASGI